MDSVHPGDRAGRRIYADHAADTPVRPAAAAALADAMALVGNPSSAHHHGQAAREVVEDARERTARAIGAQPGDLILTSGGTEANNLALKGLVWASSHRRRHVVTTAMEHAAVLAPLGWLATRGEISLTVVDPDPDGRVPVDRVLDAVREDTCLVSVMAANNVVGAVNDVEAIGHALAQGPALFHVDAVQAMHLDLHLDQWRVDAASLSAHKYGGPVGAGICLLRRGVPVHPLSHGGDQDRAVRSGTLAAGLAAAQAEATVEAVAEREAEIAHLRDLTTRFRDGIADAPGVTVLGPDDPEHRLPGTIGMAIDGIAADALVFALDRAGLSASVGPACSSGASAGNPVLEAMGLQADAGLRIAFGWTSTTEDAEGAAAIVTEVLRSLREWASRAPSDTTAGTTAGTAG